MPTGLDGNPDPVVSEERTRLLERVARAVTTAGTNCTVLVGIDGASGAGKSTFADELARTLARTGRTVVRAGIDSFHRPRVERYRLGRDSAEGYYRDSHDLPALRGQLLDPFARGAGGYRAAVFDEPSDSPVHEPLVPVPPHAVLVFDGLFLHRPELVAYWDVSVFLLAPERRAAQALPGRYVEGQAVYEGEASPFARATLVIDNDDFVNPTLIGSSGQTFSRFRGKSRYGGADD